MTPNDELADRILRHALELQRLSDYEEARIDAELRALTNELRELVTRREVSTAGKREINALIKVAEDAIAGRYVNVAGVVDLDGIVDHVAERTGQIIAETMPELASNAPIRIRTLTQAILIEGAPTAAWWAKQSEEAQSKFARTVRQGVANNWTNEQIVRKVAGGRGEVGIMDVARSQARALVHSSIMTAANQARWETLKKSMSKFAPGVEWLATLDSHTCPTCGALDGKSWDWDMKPIGGHGMQFQMPPRHWNCRCVLTPAAADFTRFGFSQETSDALANLGGRAQAGGNTGERPTFAQWLKRQPSDVVDDVLGKQRAQRFLDGKLSLTDLITKGGRPRTLEELKGR